MIFRCEHFRNDNLWESHPTGFSNKKPFPFIFKGAFDRTGRFTVDRNHNLRFEPDPAANFK
jgi:hypothetical protein